MLIESENEYNKYSYCYNRKNTVDDFLNKLESNKDNIHYINTIFLKHSYLEIASTFNFYIYNWEYYNNLWLIKSELEKYKVNYSTTTEIEINYEFKIIISNPSDFLKHIILWKDIRTIFNSKVIIDDISWAGNNYFNLEMINCEFISNFEINKWISKLDFKKCIINNTLELKNENSWPINTNTKVYWWELNLIDTSYSQLIFNDFCIWELKIVFTNDYIKKWELANNISFERWLFHKIKISCDNRAIKPKITELKFLNFKFIKDSEIFINNFKISNLEFKYVTNLTDSFKITNVKVENNFNLEDVDFWKVIFNWLDLSKSILNFIYPTFNNCIFNNIIWNENCIIINKSDKELRDIYRQMKFIMDKLWDSITWSKFYRNEMITQRKLIKDSKTHEKLIFYFWHVVNNFWQDWLRPLIILFIFNLIFWCLNNRYIFINDFTISEKLFTLSYWDNFWVNLVSYISYLTPFRKLVDNPSIWDILARILSAILIYQSAVAMRRKIER